MNKIQRHIALGVISNDNKVLVIRRREIEHGLNNETLTWVFPGGKVESNETVNDSVVREVLEETGYTVKPNSLIDKGLHPTFPAYMSYVACELTAEARSDIKEEAIAEVKWVSVTDLQNIITSSLNSKVKAYLGL